MIKTINIMKEEKVIIIHPGETLQEELLKPYKISVEELAQAIKVQPEIVKELVEKKRDLDKDLATRLALYFDMSPKFWLGLQHDYEESCLDNLQISLRKEIVPRVNTSSHA